jgi:shikimate kinase
MNISFSIPEGKIFLMGLPGSGKTYFGKQIAEANNRPFFDLDIIIETLTKKTVADIFAEQGVDAFRKIETETLLNFSFSHNAVIALGGGTPCFHNNLNWIKNQGTTIYLDADINIIAERIATQKNTRPLFLNHSVNDIKNALARLLQEREVYYKQADIIWQL